MRRWLALVLALVVITRLPFLWTGYGADHDAWLVAESASRLWNSGIYDESRLPGYPLHEILSAPLVGTGGAPLSNAATLAATLAAILVWSAVCRRAVRHERLAVVAFAFAPVVWQHSAVTLDYIWSLLCVVASLHAVLRQRVLLAGVLFGCAVGFRLANVVVGLPLLLLLSMQKPDPRAALAFVGAAVLVSACSFLPLMLKYGLPGWFVATRQEMSDVTGPTFLMRSISFAYRALYFLGPLAAATAGFIVWNGRRALWGAVRARDPVIVASVAGVVVVLLMFFWLPLDRAYLLPGLPFLLLLLDRLASRRLFAGFTVCLVFSALVSLDVIDAGDRRSFRPNIHPGMVIEEYRNRTELLRRQVEGIRPPGDARSPGETRP